jgi:hypothetical protein
MQCTWPCQCVACTAGQTSRQQGGGPQQGKSRMQRQRRGGGGREGEREIHRYIDTERRVEERERERGRWRRRVGDPTCSSKFRIRRDRIIFPKISCSTTSNSSEYAASLCPCLRALFILAPVNSSRTVRPKVNGNPCMGGVDEPRSPTRDPFVGSPRHHPQQPCCFWIPRWERTYERLVEWSCRPGPTHPCIQKPEAGWHPISAL